MAFADISFEEALVLEAYEEDILDEEETLLAFELLDKSKDPILHRNYARFDLNQFDETECEEMFRFSKEDIPRLAEALRLPNKFTGYQGTICDSIEGLFAFTPPGLSLSLCRPNSSVWPCKTRDIHH